MSEIYIKNNKDQEITLQKKIRLEYIIKYDINRFYTVKLNKYELIIKSTKRILIK